MSQSDTLIEALRDARDALIDGENVETVFQETAEVYGLNPLLVRRKFTEAYGDPSQVKVKADREKAALEQQRVNAQRAHVQTQQALQQSRRFSW